MTNIYEDSTFLLATGGTWHMEHAPWKAQQVVACIERNQLSPKSVVEVGCGAGRMLRELSDSLGSDTIHYSGYDFSSQAIELSKQFACERVEFFCGDFFDSDSESVDLLLAFDVFEHVPDYLGFLSRCHESARHKIYHIPLDISVQSTLRGTVGSAREGIGHLHYFTAETALAILEDTGHRIIDCVYTDAWRVGTLCPAQADSSLPFKTAFANIFRGSLGKLSIPWAARLFGGYSLLVLAE